MSKETLLSRIDVAQALSSDEDAQKFAALRTEIESLEGDNVTEEQFVAAFDKVDARYAN